METADRHFATYIKCRDQTCRAVLPIFCQGAYRLECAHIISRDYKALRTDEANAVALCSACHGWYTNHPEAWRKWVDREFGADYYNSLRSLAMESGDTGFYIDWNEQATYWKGQI